MLKNLQHLDLTGTKVSGDINEMMGFGFNKLQLLEEARLTGTEVTGRVTASWLGALRKLQILDLTAGA